MSNNEGQSNINDEVIYPGNITRKVVSTYNEKIIEELRTHASNTCKKDITQEYIEQVLDEIKPFSNTRYNIYTYYDSSNKLLGFVIFKLIIYKVILPTRFNNKEVYIALLCADTNNYKLGTLIVKDVEKYCFIKDIYTISLNAIPTAVDFYIKNKFIITDNNNLFMMKRLNNPIKINKINNKTRKSRRKQVNNETFLD
jgi:hypothetical protein